MKRIFAAVLVILCSPAWGQNVNIVRAEDLIESPRDFHGKTIRLKSLNCVDDPKSGFKCVALAKGQILNVEASFLGPASSLSIAAKLIGECKGTANLSSTACSFEIEITPTSSAKEMVDTASGSRSRTTVYTGQIEMFARGR